MARGDAESKAPDSHASNPKAHDPKAPDPKAHDPKAPDPKAPDPKAPDPKALDPGLRSALPTHAARSDPGASADARWGGCPQTSCTGRLRIDSRGCRVWPRQLVHLRPPGVALPVLLDDTRARDQAGADLACSVCDAAYTEVLRG